MGEGGRSLRPRGTVDYRSTTNVSKTPGWMPLGKKKPAASPASARASDKENAQPLSTKLLSAKDSKGTAKKAGQGKQLDPEPGSQTAAVQGAGQPAPSQRKPRQAAGKPGNGRPGKAQAGSHPQPTQQESAQHKVQEPSTAEPQDSRPSRNKHTAAQVPASVRASEASQPAASERSSRSKRAREPPAAAGDHTGPAALQRRDASDQRQASKPAARQPKPAEAQGGTSKAPRAAQPAAVGNQRKRSANSRQALPTRSPGKPQAPEPGQVLAPAKASAAVDAPQQPAEQGAAPKRRKLTSKSALRRPGAPAQAADAAAAENLDAAAQPQQQQAAPTAAVRQEPQPDPVQQPGRAAAQQAGQAEEVPPETHFLKLKEDYASLLQRYQQLKDTSIAGLEGVLAEHTSKERDVAESAQALAAHWEQEASRQATRAGAAAALQQQVAELQEQILDLEGRLLQEEIKRLGDKETIMDLESKITSALAAVPAVPQVQRRPPPTPGAQSVQGEHAAVEDLQPFEHQGHFAGHGEATPAAERGLPADVAGTSGMSGETPGPLAPMTGQVACRSSAKPLVPYSNTHAAGLTQCRVSGAQQARHVLSPVPAQQIPILWPRSPETPSSQAPSTQLRAPASTQGCLIAHDRRSRWEDWEEGAVAASSAARSNADVGNPVEEPAAAPDRMQGQMPQPHRLSLALSPAPTDPPRDAADSQGLPEEPQSSPQSPPHGPPQQHAARNAAASRGSSASKQPAETEVRIGRMTHDLNSGNRTQVESADVSSQQAVALLSGLQAIPSGEGFLFRHEASGFTFQLAPAPCSPGSLADPSCQAELAYVPLQLGSASQVLPDYLRYEIRCGEAQRQRLMSRVMEALASWAPGLPAA